MGGISIENYRQKIGCFQFRGQKTKLKKASQFHISACRNKIDSASVKKKKPSYYEMFLCALFYMVMFTIVYCSNHIDQENLLHCGRSTILLKASFTQQTNTKFYWTTAKSITKVLHEINGNRRMQG